MQTAFTTYPDKTISVAVEKTLMATDTDVISCRRMTARWTLTATPMPSVSMTFNQGATDAGVPTDTMEMEEPADSYPETVDVIPEYAREMLSVHGMVPPIRAGVTQDIRVMDINRVHHHRSAQLPTCSMLRECT
jgi:hypothetical protein